MGVIHLVRHGQASAHAADYDVLSDAGHAQALLLGTELKRRGVTGDRILSGSLRRQVDTATGALTTWGAAADLEIDDRWNEYDHRLVLARYAPPELLDTVGRGQRSLQDALDAALYAWVADSSGDSVGGSGVGSGGGSGVGESWAEFSERVAEATRDLAADTGSGRSAVVTTSGGVIAAVCAALVRGRVDTFVAFNRVSVNAAITTLTVGRRGLSLSSFNDHSHLDGDITFR